MTGKQPNPEQSRPLNRGPAAAEQASEAAAPPVALLPHSFNLETEFRRSHPVAWWATLIGPPAVSMVLLAVIAVVKGSLFAWRLASAAVVAFFLGKMVILGGNDGALQKFHLHLSSEQLAVLTVFMDVMVCCVLTFHLGFLFRLPFLGPKLAAVAVDGEFIVKTQPWIRRVTFIGLVLFVVLPLAATGSVGASILGRLLGMTRLATLTGAVLGSVIGALAAYFGGGLLAASVARGSIWPAVGSVALFAALIGILNLRYRRLKARYLADRQPADEPALPKSAEH